MDMTLQKPIPDEDRLFMDAALAEASKAAALGEVPVGAVVVFEGRIVGRGGNGKEAGDPTAHAEIQAIREAARVLGDWRLDSCVLYSTLEPCLMCAGAVLQARVGRVVYGATDPKFGAVESRMAAFAPAWNHRPLVQGGVAADESRELLQSFFRARRAGLDKSSAGEIG